MDDEHNNFIDHLLADATLEAFEFFQTRHTWAEGPYLSPEPKQDYLFYLMVKTVYVSDAKLLLRPNMKIDFNLNISSKPNCPTLVEIEILP